MITAYFTKDNKYLQKGDYVKHFDVGSVDELLSKIKIKDEITIITDDWLTYYSYHNEYNVVFKEDFEVFNEQSVSQDLTNLKKGIVRFLKYRPQDKWLKILGEVVYIVNDEKLQRQIVMEQNCFAFLPSDIKELNEGLKANGEIPQALVLRLFFDGKEIKELEENNALQEM